MDSQMLSVLKNIEDLLERLASIENLLERVAESNERVEDLMQKSWDAYNAPTK